MNPSLHKILIADDEVQLSNSLQMLLSAEGYRVDIAASHLDALLQIDSVCQRATTLCRQLLTAVGPNAKPAEP